MEKRHQIKSANLQFKMSSRSVFIPLETVCAEIRGSMHIVNMSYVQDEGLLKIYTNVHCKNNKVTP